MTSDFFEIKMDKNSEIKGKKLLALILLHFFRTQASGGDLAPDDPSSFYTLLRMVNQPLIHLYI